MKAGNAAWAGHWAIVEHTYADSETQEKFRVSLFILNNNIFTAVIFLWVLVEIQHKTELHTEHPSLNLGLKPRFSI